MQIPPRCPYCGSWAKLVGGDVIYPHRPDLKPKQFWQCSPCDAYVGCHAPGNGYGDGTRPLGTLANAELRRARNSVHRLLDTAWMVSNDRRAARRRVYADLAAHLGIPVDDCHVACFDLGQCDRAIDYINDHL